MDNMQSPSPASPIAELRAGLSKSACVMHSREFLQLLDQVEQQLQNERLNYQSHLEEALRLRSVVAQQARAIEGLKEDNKRLGGIVEEKTAVLTRLGGANVQMHATLDEVLGPYQSDTRLDLKRRVEIVVAELKTSAAAGKALQDQVSKLQESNDTLRRVIGDACDFLHQRALTDMPPGEPLMSLLEEHGKRMRENHQIVTDAGVPLVRLNQRLAERLRAWRQRELNTEAALKAAVQERDELKRTDLVSETAIFRVRECHQLLDDAGYFPKTLPLTERVKSVLEDVKQTKERCRRATAALQS